MCRTHISQNEHYLQCSKIALKLALENNIQNRTQYNLFKHMPILSMREISLAMEKTFVKTLPCNHINIAFHSKLTF